MFDEETMKDLEKYEQQNAQAAAKPTVEAAPVQQLAVKVKSTALTRFHARIAKFRDEGKSVWVHHFWWFVHNGISHPLIGVLPVKWTFDFHDWTSLKINGR